MKLDLTMFVRLFETADSTSVRKNKKNILQQHLMMLDASNDERSDSNYLKIFVSLKCHCRKGDVIL